MSERKRIRQTDGDTSKQPNMHAYIQTDSYTNMHTYAQTDADTNVRT